MAKKTSTVPKMKKLTTEQRNNLPNSAFADPAQRKYPVKVSSLPGFSKEQDIAYASAAGKRGAQQKSMGNLSTSKETKVKSKAKKMLNTRGYAPKGKSKVNIDEALRGM